MDYKERFYKRYISSHTKTLYGEQSLTTIKKQFVAWESYFGRFLPENKYAEIIDLGCGNGGFVYWLQQEGFKNVMGIDISEEQVAEAEKLGIKNIYLVDLREFLRNKAGVYDLIFARDILEHFTKEENVKIVELIYKSLRKKWRFSSTDRQCRESVMGAACYSFDRHIGTEGESLGINDVQLDTRGDSRLIGFVKAIWVLYDTIIFGVMRSDCLKKTRLHQLVQGPDHVVRVELSLLGSLVQIREPLFSIRVHKKENPQEAL